MYNIQRKLCFVNIRNIDFHYKTGHFIEKFDTTQIIIVNSAKNGLNQCWFTQICSKFQ